MERDIIEVNEEKCTGCGVCIPGCPEGALQVIDGKARLVSDLLCDGLGACVGECPEGAMRVIKREAESYDERKAMLQIIPQGHNTIIAHLKHLKEHGQQDLLYQAFIVLEEEGIPINKQEIIQHAHSHGSGCPGSRMRSFDKKSGSPTIASHVQPSALHHWPVQLHLISPLAPYYEKADVLLAADCTAFSVGNFHEQYLKGKSLAIACPKLDSGIESYIEKITILIDQAKINTLTVMIMQVPCCSGLLHIAQQAAKHAKRKIPIKKLIISLEGDNLSEEWI